MPSMVRKWLLTKILFRSLLLSQGITPDFIILLTFRMLYTKQMNENARYCYPLVSHKSSFRARTIFPCLFRPFAKMEAFFHWNSLCGWCFPA